MIYGNLLKVMKTWKVKVYCPYGEEIFVAYAEKNPIDNELISYNALAEIYENLWNNYGYILTEHIEEDLDEEAYEEECDQLYDDFMCDTGADAEEMSIEDIKLLTPSGADPEVIYDERTK